MPSRSHPVELDSFIILYNDLFSRFEHDENARALFNEVALEMLSAHRRDEGFLSLDDARSYFLSVLSRKGFNFKGGFWRDVDLGRHQCARRPVVNVPLENYDYSADGRFALDPRQSVANRILADQVVETLADDEKALLSDRHVEELTLREIGESLQMTPQGVKKRLDKIYRRLRDHVEQEERVAAAP